MRRKVLVPLDGSELSECALKEVEMLAKDGIIEEVTLLNVFTVDFPWSANYETPSFNLIAYRDQLLTESRKYLESMSAGLAAKGITVKTETVEANHPADAINDFARKHGMDMIVIATHGYSGMKRMLLGSVALGLVNQSHVPVYLIRPEACRA
jgi:nucleotide-binding universal stress UspA family protein